MGVDVVILMDLGSDRHGADQLLANLKTTHASIERVWGPLFHIPTNAGLKALDTETFRKKYAANWRLENEGVGMSGKDGDEKHNVATFVGPHGFSADIYADSVAVHHGTRWAAFTGDAELRRRMITTACLVARALCSRRIIFFPDSVYRVSSCLDGLEVGGKFDAVVKCARSSMQRLDQPLPTESKGLEVFSVKTDDEESG